MWCRSVFSTLENVGGMLGGPHIPSARLDMFASACWCHVVFTGGFASLFVYPTQLLSLLYTMEPENDDVEVQLIFLFQPGNPYFELSIRRGISNGCKSGVSHASNFEAVESLSSTHVDCRNQQASEVFHGNLPLNCEILRTLDTNILKIIF